ncbi:hypothetical protein CY34DRAFT_678307 [Suillus luteus UH-Slu-Lm8-n1]|uniref:Uncharacterized protein n=1 Tax=Suillus luteus UH-Slu-Lm8-n1 TaxID=930992 RepID=A0A0C9Z8Y4_9AGAM|nr:hypothetical protein CY34DRAFT_678307 [Suillus luteus UH-Slu-Lm8-n1]
MMKQWARMYNTPLVTHQSVLATHAGPHGQALTTGRDINFTGSFVKDSDFESKHDK